jgi:hypothetical protein
MKYSSVFGVLATGLLAFTSLVAASPVAETDLIVKKQALTIDVILTDLITSCKTTDASYNSTASGCSGSCSTSIITSWCSEIAGHCSDAITKCKTLPSGYKAPDKATCVSLVVELLLEIQFTLAFLLSKCGILAIVGSVISLVATLITALNALLACLAIYVDGLLVAVATLLYSIIGLLGCLLCTCGLIL